MLSPYQKIAILITRLAASTWTVFFGFAWAIYGMEVLSGVDVRRYPTHTLMGNIAYVFGGLVVLALAKPIGCWLGRGLGE